MMRCPVCRAENQEHDTTCRRCRADLSLLVALEQARQGAITAAADAAGKGDGRETVARARIAHDLRPGEDTDRWLAVGYFLQRDFTQALAHQQRK